MKYYAPLIRNKNYAIDINFNLIYKEKPLYPMDINGEHYIKIRNSIISVSKIYIETFYGFEPWVYDSFDSGLDIFYKDCDSFEYKGTIFKRIIGREKFFISEFGTVISFSRKKHGKGKILKRRVSENGYFVVHIQEKILKLHREVYKAFCGQIDDGYILDHLNGNKCDPRLRNLELVTYGENTRRSLSMGLQKGKRWDETEIRDICKKLEQNLPLDEIYSVYSVKASRRTIIMLIHLLRSGKMFSDITKDYDLSHYNSTINKKDRKLTEENVIFMRKNKDIYSISDFVKMFNVSPSTIRNIINGVKWKNVR